MTDTEMVRERAMLAVAAVPADTEGSRRLRAVKILRDSVRGDTGLIPTQRARGSARTALRGHPPLCAA